MVVKDKKKCWKFAGADTLMEGLISKKGDKPLQNKL